MCVQFYQFGLSGLRVEAIWIFSYVSQCHTVRASCWSHGHNLNDFGRWLYDDVISHV